MEMCIHWTFELWKLLWSRSISVVMVEMGKMWRETVLEKPTDAESKEPNMFNSIQRDSNAFHVNVYGEMHIHSRCSGSWCWWWFMASHHFSQLIPNLPLISDVVSSLECCLPANRNQFSPDISIESKNTGRVNVNKRLAWRCIQFNLK